MSKKSLGGRPTKYTAEVLQAAKEYLVAYEDHGHAVPSVAGLSLVLNVGRSTLYEWAKQEGKEQFADILEQINAKQEQEALSKGLKGDWNAAIVKLLLGKHGYSDKQETELSGPKGGPVPIIFNGVASDGSRKD